jgi:type IV pilus assembly protein PilC
MLFSRQLPLASLIDLCHVLRVSLGAGISLRDVFRQQAQRGPAAVRALATRVHKQLDRGYSLETALEGEREVLPPLFLSMTSVGEATGHLPEIFGELEKYYRGQQQLRRYLRSRTVMPALQFLLAVLIIAGVLIVLGSINAARGAAPPRIFGLSGVGGAVLFLILVGAGIGLAYVSYAAARRKLLHRPAIDALLLHVPRLGPCLKTLALGRFAMALQMTLDSGVSVAQALRLALAATGNGAFVGGTAAAEHALKKGNTLTAALTETNLFPHEFLDMVAVGEESGRVPEVLRHQAGHYAEEAQERMTALSRAIAGAVWLAYVVFMAAAIFQIAGIYLRALGG